ncbi:MAG: DUF4160 domain-containing protein [Hyphomicrobiaceae bacterium]|nr:DUF4160 domain-containing protein [Hyphomicrobiaceae bacterium]
MPTIAIVAGAQLVLYPKDHLPPHLHALFGEYEAMISIATGDILQGKIPGPKAQAIRAWLKLHREEVAFAWSELRAGRNVGRIG